MGLMLECPGDPLRTRSIDASLLNDPQGHPPTLERRCASRLRTPENAVADAPPDQLRWQTRAPALY